MVNVVKVWVYTMSNPPETLRSIYPGVSVPQSYSAVDAEEKKNDYNTRMSERDIQLEDWKTKRWRMRLEAEEAERNKPFCERYAVQFQITVCILTLVVLGIVAIYLFSILLGTLVIVSNYVFETTMVSLFGRATYNKNFPRCSITNYAGSDCYSTTKLYCS